MFGKNNSILNNDTILWFIILFLLLFCNCGKSKFLDCGADVIRD